MPVSHALEVEEILDTKVAKSTRQRDYLEYLVKWKAHPVEDATWMSVVELSTKGFFIADLMNRGSLFFKMSHHTKLDENLEGADNFRAWKYRISLVLEENGLDTYIRNNLLCKFQIY